MQKKIIVGYDGSSWSHAALLWALDEASRTAAPVELVYADDYPLITPAASMVPSSGRRPLSYVTEIIDGTLGHAVIRAKQIQPLVNVDSRVISGRASPALIDLSKHARLIVLGGRGHSAVGGLLGSVGSAVSAHAHCPVVMVRGEAPAAAPVVAGIDGSAMASPVLIFAAKQASARKVPLRVIRTWPPVTGLWEETAMVTNTITDHEREPFDALVTDVRDEYPDLVIEAEASVAHPAAALTAASAGAQLLVVGSRGHGAFSGLLLGSVSQHLLRSSACTIAVVHREL